MSSFPINVQPIIDNQWHYMCLNLKQAAIDNKRNTNLQVFQVNL